MKGTAFIKYLQPLYICFKIRRMSILLTTSLGSRELKDLQKQDL